jgi:hypothetical protein
MNRLLASGVVLSLRPPPILAPLVASALLGGCALVGREVKLEYPPPGESVSNAPEPLPPAIPPVAVVVTDERPDRIQVGSVRNALGMKMAAITTQGDVPAWVKGALETELRAAGLRVVPSPDGAALLAAQVQVVECDAYFSYGADVVLKVEFSSGGNLVHALVYKGQGGAGTNWTATEASYSLSLSMALRSAAVQVAAGVKSALSSGVALPSS